MGVHVSLEQPPTPTVAVEDIPQAIEEALSALDDIEARYRHDREGLHAWVGPDRAKERLLARLQARYKAEREPLAIWLLALRSPGGQTKVLTIGGPSTSVRVSDGIQERGSSEMACGERQSRGDLLPTS